MAKFSDLNLSKPLLKAIDEMGFEEVTPIQEQSFSIIMSGRDAVGIAQTGTGKTWAYLIPILRQLTYSEQRQPRVLIVVPTRELVAQVVGEVEKLSKYMSLRVFGVYGASNINTQKQRVWAGLDILVGTPGRLIDLVISRAVQFGSIKKLVIDEADEMLNLGFRPQLTQLLDVMPRKRQNLMFSATMSDDVDKVIQIFFVQPEYIEVITRGTPADKVAQQAYFVKNFFTKVNLLKLILSNKEEFSRVLVFVKNKSIATDLEMALEDFKDEMGIMHSNKSQANRFEAINKFQEGQLRFIIATDVMARGLDLQGITHVINFDIPADPDIYIHRIGRTGRADQSGIAISLVSEFDVVKFKAINEKLKKDVVINENPEDLVYNNDLTSDELPVTRDKSLRKVKKLVISGGGGFHQKKAKNNKEQLGGKRRQEKQRRALVLSKSKRKR